MLTLHLEHTQRSVMYALYVEKDNSGFDDGVVHETTPDPCARLQACAVYLMRPRLPSLWSGSLMCGQTCWPMLTVRVVSG